MEKCSEGEENDFNRTVSLIGDGYKNLFICRRLDEWSNGVMVGSIYLAKC